MSTETAPVATPTAPAVEAPKPNPMIIPPAVVPPSPDDLLVTKPATEVPAAVPAPPATPVTTVKADNLASLGVDSSDPSIKVVVSYVDTIASKTSLDLQRAVGHSLEQNNSAFVDEAYIRDTVKDKAEAESVISMLKGVIDHQGTIAKKVIQDVYTKAGGEANWRSAVAYFNKSATPEHKEAMKTLLASGNQASINHAVQQVLSAAKDGGVTISHVATPFGGNTSEKGWTREEFTKVIQNSRSTDAEIANARRLRAVGMKNGI